MRLFLLLWFVPMVLFWGWFGLSANGIDFGYLILSRDVHDHVLNLYANALNLDRNLLPGMIAGACLMDSAIVLAIAAFRWRAEWYPQFRAMVNSYWFELETGDRFDEFTIGKSGQVHPAE